MNSASHLPMLNVCAGDGCHAEDDEQSIIIGFKLTEALFLVDLLLLSVGVNSFSLE